MGVFSSGILAGPAKVAVAFALTLMLAGSVANQWPLDVAAPPVAAESIRGDVDRNGTVDSIDALHTLFLGTGLLGPDPNEGLYGKADLNSDGVINSLDALLILQFHAGMIEKL